MSKLYRLDKILSGLGYGSRREVQSLVSYGCVTLAGETIKRADHKIPLDDFTQANLFIEDEIVDKFSPLTIILNKPVGVVCSHKEAGVRIYDLLPLRWRRRDPAISTVGRLDKDTSGLLLLTDDGQLLHKIISPKHQVTKTYKAVLDRPLRDDAEKIFASGTMMLESEDTPLLPAKLERIDAQTCLVTISEGRYHQVRRMFAALDNHVNELHRISVGGLTLGDLPEGEMRMASAADIHAVFNPIA